MVDVLPNLHALVDDGAFLGCMGLEKRLSAKQKNRQRRGRTNQGVTVLIDLTLEQCVILDLVGVCLFDDRHRISLSKRPISIMYRR